MAERETQELAGEPGADGQPFVSLPQYDCIHHHPGILCGKPVIKGTRISVELLKGFLAAGDDAASIRKRYPQLSERAILQAGQYEGDTGPLVKVSEDELPGTVIEYTIPIR